MQFGNYLGNVRERQLFHLPIQRLAFIKLALITEFLGLMMLQSLFISMEKSLGERGEINGRKGQSISKSILTWISFAR